MADRFKYGNNNNHRMRIVVCFSPPQRLLFHRLLEGEDITLMEAIRTFSVKQINRYEEAGLWIKVKPSQLNNKIMMEA